MIYSFYFFYFSLICTTTRKMVKCTLKLSKKINETVNKILYRTSFFDSPINNSLVNERNGYKTASFDTNDSTFDLEIDHSIHANKGYIINIYFYANTNYYKSNHKSQHLIMWCDINDHRVKSFKVFEQGYDDVTEKIQLGILTLEGDLPPQNEYYKNQVKKEIAHAQQYIERVVIQKYQDLEDNKETIVENSSYFHYVNEIHARLPMVFFPLMSTFTGWSNSINAMNMYVNLLNIAKFNCGVDQAVGFDELIKTEKFDLCAVIIQEMFTVTIRCMQYRDDQSATGQKNIDRWSVVNVLPELSRASFDCEDGSRQVMDLIYALLKLHPEIQDLHPELNSLCRFLRCYTLFFSIGDLYINENVAVHVYCVLMDTSYIRCIDESTDHNVNSAHGFLPSIHLETTHHSVGTWSSRNVLNTMETRHYSTANDTLSELTTNSSISRHIVKLRAPLSCKMKDDESKLYVNTRVLISPWYDGQVVQFLVTQGMKSHADTTEFMNNNKDIKLKVLYKTERLQLERDYAYLFSTLPCGNIPEKPLITEEKQQINNYNVNINYQKVVAQFEIQESFFNERKDEYTKLLQTIKSSFGKMYDLYIHRLKIVNGLNIVQAWMTISDSSFSSSRVSGITEKQDLNEIKSLVPKEVNKMMTMNQNKMKTKMMKMKNEVTTAAKSQARDIEKVYEDSLINEIQMALMEPKGNN